MDTYIVFATDFIQSVCECWYIPVWYSLGANPHHIGSRPFSTVLSDATFTDRLFSTIASDASRQKIIFLREAHGQGFGVAHLGFEQFLEA